MEEKCCNEYFPKKEKNRDRCCLDVVLGGIILALVFFIGLLVGTLGVLAEILTVGIIVSLIIVFAILAILRIITLICYGKRC